MFYFDIDLNDLGAVRIINRFMLEWCNERVKRPAVFVTGLNLKLVLLPYK